MMINNKFQLILIFILQLQSSVAQVCISGTVIDSDTKNGIPYVNIGIRNKNIGCSSKEDGTFFINLFPLVTTDTITFSMVGYSELNLSIGDIISANQKTFTLKAKIIHIPEFNVSTSRLVEKGYGIKNNGTLIHFTDGSTNQNDIFEIAQLIKLGNVPVKITSVNLHINEYRSDSGIFRINFYALDKNMPSNRIIEKNIIQKHEIKPGWLKFDLTNENIYLKGEFVVSIEFIPSEKKNNPIYYEVKLGGSAKSFMRGSSLGEWTVPPHHYRLYVTALVPDNNKKQDDSEEKDTAPSKVMFSEFVKDTFSIFINLPDGYYKSKRKNYPVIYLLDANVYFDLVVNTMKENKMNDAILVGIGYKDVILMDSLRDRDYTFPKALPNDSFLISGGADKFLSFIETELTPYIDNNYNTDINNRSIMGHSLGGYFPLFILQKFLSNKNSFFKNYVAASPSLSYCNNYILNQFRETSNLSDANLNTLFVSIGEREDSEEGGNGTKEMDNFRLFVKILSDEKFKNIKLMNETYPNFGHMQTAVPSFEKALRRILKP